MPRLLAISLNIFLFGFILFISITQGFGLLEWWEFIWIILLFVSPVINILALINGNNWIGLYFKRKAMEEKNKISELEKKSS